MADDTIPQDDPAPLTSDERLAAASDWSDYRKDYGVSAEPGIRSREHDAFIHAWRAGHRSAERTLARHPNETIIRLRAWERSQRVDHSQHFHLTDDIACTEISWRSREARDIAAILGPEPVQKRQEYPNE